MGEKRERILALSPREALIKRINVYFGRETGDTDNPFSSQKSVLLREIVDNSIDILKKNSKSKGTIKISFNEDGSVIVQDSGTGIPTEISQTAQGVPASSVYLAMGELNAGSNYENVTSSIGTNGVGGSGAQMLSEYMKIQVYKNNKVYQLDFKDGVPGFFDVKGVFRDTLADLKKLKVSKDDRSKEDKKLFPTGTKIEFKINNKLLKSPYPFNISDIKERMVGTSYLEPGIKFIVEDNFSDEPGNFIYNNGGGIQAIVRDNTPEDRESITPVFSVISKSSFVDDSIDVTSKDTKVSKITKEVSLEASFAWNNGFDYKLDSYVNTIKTRLGGIHVDAFEKALVKVFNSKMQSMRGFLSKNEKNLPIFEDYAEGLTLAISVFIPEPEFTSQIKEELGGRKASREFTKAFSEVLENWVNERKNSEAVKKIAEKVIEAYKIRVRRKEEMELRKEIKEVKKISKMPPKLIDCEITHDPNSELFIAEGDSALTGLKGARNSKYQAIFPIRGKLINTLRATPKQMLGNQEIQDILKCLDAGVGSDYKHSEARYSKIFIATDADPDGANIATLLFTALWKIAPDAVEKGAVYKVLTPLYIIKTKKKTYYCLDDKEKDVALKKIGTQKYELTRAKGLGETGREALEFTGMNPETRRVQKVTIQDLEKAKSMLDIVMGESVEPRRDWLESQGKEFADE